jgi:shikimate dehydrogenase
MNLYGLIGYPLGHSFSRQFFEEKFEKEGLMDSSFRLFPLEHIDKFPTLLAGHPSLKGLAVTIPHKQAIISYLHELAEEAKAIGAVNCIQFKNGLLKGYNTDVIGFESSFSPLRQPHHTKALILGTGGASKAVQYIFQKLAIPFKLVSRQAAHEEGIMLYSELDETIMTEHKIIVNCSPVGMSPNENEKPAIPYKYVSNSHYLYDLVYKPAETEFLLEGKKRGATIKNGLEMLIIQAEENWRIWNLC